MRRRALAICLPLLVATGCGASAQSFIGWTSIKATRREPRNQRVHLQTRPPGAHVSRVLTSTSVRPLGPGPVDDFLRFEVERQSRAPTAWGLLIGGAVETLLGAGLIAAHGGQGFSQPCGEPSGDDTCISPRGIGILALGIGAIELVGGLAYRVLGSHVEEEVNVPSEYRYRITGDGFDPVERTVEVPGPETQTLYAVPASPRQDTSREVIVLVTEVVDTNHGTELAVGGQVTRNLGRFLHARLAELGVHTTERGGRYEALEAEILATKQGSYDQCVDEACQIELGKALAASHIVSPMITRFGEACVLSTQVVDLRGEVTVLAANARGPCEPGSFLDLADEVAQQIAQGL